MSFAGSASHHQRTCTHEARPKTPYAGNDFREGAADAGEKILVDQEIGLDRTDGSIVLDDQITVIESVLQRVFQKLVDSGDPFALARMRIAIAIRPETSLREAILIVRAGRDVEPALSVR